MKRLFLLFVCVCLPVQGFPGFKSKNIKPKKPEQYQTSTTIGGVTFSADILLDAKSQKDFFYKELTSSDIIAVRLAVFNNSRGGVILPLDGIQLTGPGGDDLPLVPPEAVAQAVLQGMVVKSAEQQRKQSPISVGPNTRTTDPRSDKTDPRYDPRLDPNDPTYDPTDPRNRGSNDPRYGDPRYNDPRYGRGYPMPGIVLSPGGGGGDSGSGDLSQYEKQLAEKDFSDKAHSTDPIDGSMVRDRFLYFSLKDRPAGEKGFTLRLSKSKGIPQEILLRF